MREDLNYLLFRKIVYQKDGSEALLFRFQSELAEAIVKESEGYIGKDDKSIRPYLSQTLKKSGTPNERSMSDKLKKAIIGVIESRLNENDPLYPNLSKEFERAYNLLKAEDTKGNKLSEDKEFRELSTWQKEANRTVIFNSQPSEVKWVPDKVDSIVEGLMEALIKNLFKNFVEGVNLIDLAGQDKFSPTLKSENSNELYYYHFYVPSFNVGKEVWSGILKYIVHKYFPEESSDDNYEKRLEQAIKILNTFNEFQTEDSNEITYHKAFQFVRIHKVDGFLTSIPVVYYECVKGVNIATNQDGNGIVEYEALFNLVLSKGIHHSVVKITGEDLEFWKENVYYPLHWSDDPKFEIEEINLTKVLSHILRTIKKD